MYEFEKSLTSHVFWKLQLMVLHDSENNVRESEKFCSRYGRCDALQIATSFAQQLILGEIFPTSPKKVLNFWELST